uniref:Uncharacterized protein n=1 Tax=Rhodnius prolixus TaxID=13249 RepID=T1HG28_RHOPR
MINGGQEDWNESASSDENFYSEFVQPGPTDGISKSVWMATFGGFFRLETKREKTLAMKPSSEGLSGERSAESGKPRDSDNPLSLFEEQIERLGKTRGKTLAEMKSIVLYRDLTDTWPERSSATNDAVDEEELLNYLLKSNDSYLRC